MTQATDKNAAYLTEAILAIHNEVQSALDYISTKATTDGTELGKSTAILSIQNLRVKLPIKISIENTKKKLEPLPTRALTPKEIEQALPKRVGFVIERDLPKNFSVVSKIRVAFTPQEAAATATKAPATGETAQTSEEAGWGEIEISFAPIKRE
jgi:hypothetical protein